MVSRKNKKFRINRLVVFLMSLLMAVVLVGGSTSVAESPAVTNPPVAENPGNDPADDRPEEPAPQVDNPAPAPDPEPEPESPEQIALSLYPPKNHPILYSLTSPIPGSNVPNRSGVLPNAPRSYRDGTHFGMDLYQQDMLKDGIIFYGQEVLAAGSGVITRIDSGYVEMTPEYRSGQLDKAVNMEDKQSPEYMAILDRMGGRQVWIDHGGGVETRYLHLSGVNENLQVGDRVEPGDLIGSVGNSGTGPGARGEKTGEVHLHFEIWLGGQYLGSGIDDWKVVRALLNSILSD